MARLVAALTALLVSAGFAACGGGDAEPRAEQPGAREVGEPVIVADDDRGDGGTPLERTPDVRELDDLPDVGVSGGSSACGAVDEEPTRESVDEAAATILCLVNAERTARGLRALRLESRLSRASRAHAADMVVNRYFSHDSRDGRTVLQRVKATGYAGRRGAIVGENLGWGSGSFSTPQSVVDGWMASPGHRANILQRR
ncbi:MAG TPA: CAP domain-containing protein, partial [Solirubrobacteraceae bacterium]|nr:CAP domain-containing protein [Solirubrobacteraceae bacterium]